ERFGDFFDKRGKMELTIEYLNPSDLKPYEFNARHHTQPDVEIARDYIEKVGGFEKFAEWGLI
ncbi:MAG: hypothetical protein IJ091_11410, partial [Oscillospiraceae bacterium]|nr:hypothetical protein [Oscillospiraceae bacterium]